MTDLLACHYCGGDKDADGHRVRIRDAGRAVRFGHLFIPRHLMLGIKKPDRDLDATGWRHFNLAWAIKLAPAT